MVRFPDIIFKQLLLERYFKILAYQSFLRELSLKKRGNARGEFVHSVEPIRKIKRQGIYQVLIGLAKVFRAISHVQ